MNNRRNQFNSGSKLLILLLAILAIQSKSIAQSTNPAPFCDGKFDDMDGTFPVDDHITSVSLGTLNNVSNGQFAAPHYVFYNNLTAPNLSIGTAYNLALKFTVAGGAGYGVWIDYNHNNTFDSNEKVAGTNATTFLQLGNNIVANASITIPATAISGSTRMRIRIVEDDMYTMANGANIAACNAGTTPEAIMDWGETEDYNLMIVGGSSQSPVVNSTTASAITSSGASIAGSVNANGGPACTVSFEYGTTIAYGASINASPASVSGSTLSNVSATLNGLLPNTLYHFRTKAVAGGQSYFGTDKTFTTSAAAPLVNSTTASAITSSGASIAGSVNANGGPACTVSFEYGTTIAYGASINASPASVSGSTLSNVSATLNGLLPNTLYHFRTKAVAGGQSYFGTDKTFTTSAAAPIVNSTTASAITTSGASIAGSVNANGGPACTVSFEFGTTIAYGASINASPASVSGSTLSTVNATLSGLLPNTLYHFRTKAVAGGQSYFGTDKTFTTALATAVFPSKAEISFKLFPNPFSEQFFIEASEENTGSEFKVISLDGRQISFGKLQSGLNSIESNSWASGIYSIRVFTSGKVLNFRLAKH